MTATLTREKSDEAYKALCDVTPGGVNSAGRSFAGVNQTPMIAERGVADMLYDVDGHGYIDYVCSWGALIHGHANPAILGPAAERMLSGTSFGMSTRIEAVLAAKIIELMPSIERIRFVSTGTEATMSAARLARGATGRPVIVKFTGNYHGHADFFLVQAGSGVAGLTATSSSMGIPEEIVAHTACLPYNDAEALRDYLRGNGQRVAGVIFEPIACNMGVVPPTDEFLRVLMEETKRCGALLICDEVITGLRAALGGAQAMYGFKADITCLGKIIGGGFPVAAFGGRRDIMDHLAPLGKVYQAGTLSGNPVAMEAGLQALRLCEKPGVYEELTHKANVITEPARKLLKEKGANACVQQVGSMFTFFFGLHEMRSFEDAQSLDKEMFVRFFKYLFNRGIFIPQSQYEAAFVSTVHTEEHLANTRDVILQFIQDTY